MRRLRALVAAFLALWTPVLIGLPMSADPAASAMVAAGTGSAQDGMAVASMPGMAAMGGAMRADAPASVRDEGTPSQPSHHHDRCCVICPCCGAVVPLPAPAAFALAPAFVGGDAPDHAPASLHAAPRDGERPPVRAPPTLLDV